MLCAKEMSLVCVARNIKTSFFFPFISLFLFVHSFYFKQVALLFCTLCFSFVDSTLSSFFFCLLCCMLCTPIFPACRSGNEKMPLTFLFRVFFLRRSFHELLLPFIICCVSLILSVCVCRFAGGGCCNKAQK